jgi:hypothetical protein
LEPFHAESNELLFGLIALILTEILVDCNRTWSLLGLVLQLIGEHSTLQRTVSPPFNSESGLGPDENPVSPETLFSCSRIGLAPPRITETLLRLPQNWNPHGKPSIHEPYFQKAVSHDPPGIQSLIFGNLVRRLPERARSPTSFCVSKLKSHNTMSKHKG